MCLVHEKLICDCDQKLQVTKNTAKAFSSPILLLQSRNQTPFFIPKAPGEKKNFFSLVFF